MRLCRLGIPTFILLFTPRSAFAVDPFEIQVYDGTANKPGVPGLELHINSVLRGTTRAPSPELPQDRQTHFTLEPSLGIFPWWEIGGYFQTALLGDGTFEYAGVKLRNKFVTTRDLRATDGCSNGPSCEQVRLGVNFELSLLPEHYDRNRWGGEIRPIAAFENDRWEFVVNPIVDVSFAGPDYSAGPTFEPAAMGLFKVRALSFGIEYYSNLGPFSSGFVPWREQEQYIFQVVNVLSIPRVEMNLGMGEGLTDASNTFVVKMILGYSWEGSEGGSTAFTPLRAFPKRN